MGATRANFARLWTAALFLTFWAYRFGGGLRGAGMPTFIVSGILGFGLSDLRDVRDLAPARASPDDPHGPVPRGPVRRADRMALAGHPARRRATGLRRGDPRRG